MTKTFAQRTFTGTIDYYGKQCRMEAKALMQSLDGQHPYFSLTGSIWVGHGRTDRDPTVGGSIHEEITSAFKELEKYVKWHCTSTEGPMHYVANSVYHAGYARVFGKPGEFYPASFEYLKRTAVWGVLDGETDDCLRVLISNENSDMFEYVLNKRLPMLMAVFRNDMCELFGNAVLEAFDWKP